MAQVREKFATRVNSEILAAVRTLAQSEGRQILKTSPAAWRHVHMNGHYTFRSNGPIIDLDAVIAGLDFA